MEKRKKVYIFFLFPNLKLSFALKCQGTDAKSECLMLSLVTLLDYGLMITMTVLIVIFNCHKMAPMVSGTDGETVAPTC